jgi:hypothetical protein
VYVFHSGDVPSRVDRFTLASGQREFVMSLGTGDRAGLIRVISVSMADDPRVYGYTCGYLLSSLVVVDGAR